MMCVDRAPRRGHLDTEVVMAQQIRCVRRFSEEYSVLYHGIERYSVPSKNSHSNHSIQSANFQVDEFKWRSLFTLFLGHATNVPIRGQSTKVGCGCASLH
jgi:hypothetical protein